MSSSRLTKIAFIMGKMDSGGKKTLAMQYFQNLNPRFFEVHFICDEDSNAIPDFEIVEAGGFVHRVAPYQNIVKNMIDICRVLMREGIEIVHAFNSTMNVFPLFVAKCCGVPVRISESLSMAHDKEPKTYLKLVLRVFSRCFATHFMACGEDCGRWQFGDKAFEHGNVDVFKTAIDSRINAYSPSVRVETRSELGIGENDLTVGFIGRFAPQKNPIFIMQIMKEILRLRPSAKMILIGDGGLRDAMFSILDPDVCGSVIYLGRTENIVKFYQAIDVFLLPSLYEGLPVVGLEAQCAGCTVLFSEEITREASFCENAFFYPLSEGAAKWAEKVIELYDERKPRRSMVEECVRAAFDAREETKRLEEYYLEALGSERRKRLF